MAKSQKLLIILLLICAGILGMIYIMEHFFGFLPCQMCLYERYVFIAAGGLLVLTLLFVPLSFQPMALIVLGFIFLGGAFLSAYHVAIQQHWLSLPAFCTAHSFNSLDSVEAVREAMLNTPLVRCDQITGKLFGLSLAAYNAILSFILAITCWTGSQKIK